MFDSRLPISINGVSCTLAFDLAAAKTLDLEFHITLEDLDKLQKQTNRSYGEELDLLQKLVYSMTRSSDTPPTMKDIDRMSMSDLRALGQTVPRLISASMEAGLGKTRAAAVPMPKATSESRAVGTGSSSKRSTASGSRRKKS